MLNTPTYQKYIAKLTKEMVDKSAGKTGGQSMRSLLSQAAKLIREQHAEIERLSQPKTTVSNKPKDPKSFAKIIQTSFPLRTKESVENED